MSKTVDDISTESDCVVHNSNYLHRVSSMDLLSDILSTLNLKGMLYFRTEFSGKWAVTVPTLAEAAPTAAVAAYGAFIMPKVLGEQIKATTPEYALYGFATFYAVCIVLNWIVYLRKGVEHYNP